MKKISYKIIVIMCFTIGLLFMSKTISNAATANVTTNNKDVTVGDSVSINVSVDAIAWNLKVSGAGISDTIVGGNMEELANKKTNKSFKLDTSKAGTYTVQLSGDITDANGTTSDISKTVSVKVSEKVQVEQPKQEEPKQETPKQETPKTETPKQETPKPAEPTFRQVNETVYVQTETVNVRGTWSASGGQYGTLKKGDSVTRTGISSEQINGYVWSRISYNGKTAYVISSALTTTKPEEKEEEKEDNTTNKALKELSVENYELTPNFDPQTTKYSLTLKDGDDKLKITATPEAEKATVNITGNENFKVGNNIVKITVTAQDGTTRIYTITVSKTNEDGVVDMLKLSSLKISNVVLQPSFDPEITNYVIEVEDPKSIKVQDIVALAEKEDAEVTVAENEQSENGEKIITIMLENKDSSKTGVYQITVKKPVANTIETLKSNNSNTIYYILGGIIAILVILILIIIIALKRTGSEDDEIDIKDEDELSDNYDFSLKNAIDNVNDDYSNYDEMVENSNLKSQILNSDINNIRNDVDMDDDDFKPDVAQRKKGKHF